MATLLVTYDLITPGQNYQPLWDRLAEWRAVRALQSVWFVNTNSTAAALRDDLARYIDANDRLFVGTLGASAWQNLMGQSGQTLRAWVIA